VAVMSHKANNSSGAVKAAETGPSESEAAASPSPSATPLASSSASHDSQRQAGLAAYLAAYKAGATNGFFEVNPPVVNVNATDPGTGQPYVVSKNKPTAPGQIQYWPGGVCTGTPHTPGLTGTRFLALVTLLDDGTTPYCLDSSHN
jgi:hypothetical protein